MTDLFDIACEVPVVLHAILGCVLSHQATLGHISCPAAGHTSCRGGATRHTGTPGWRRLHRHRPLVTSGSPWWTVLRLSPLLVPAETLQELLGGHAVVEGRRGQRVVTGGRNLGRSSNGRRD